MGRAGAWEQAVQGVAAWVSDHAGTVVRDARLLFFVLAILFVLAAWRSAAGTAPARVKAGRVGGGGALLVVVACLLAIVLYQATWQLTGFTRPAFVSFMRKHSHRTLNPAEAQTRGRILDRHGVVLATDDAAGGGRRRYPLGEACAHLVGYHDAMYGQTGLESADDRSLSGAGTAALNDWRRFGQGVLDHRQATGNTLTLTLDAELQKRAMILLGGRPGAVVGIRPADGAILILASSPSFDPNLVDPARLKRQANTPMFNRALQGLYAPGSTFKIVTAVKAVEAGITGRFDCPAAGFTPPGHKRPIRDHEYYEAQRRNRPWRGHGIIDLEEAFARSSNVYFSRLGTQLGAEAMNEVAARFGFNRQMPIYVGSSGELAADESKFPSLSASGLGEVAQISIGQGTLAVTPLQMALVAAAIANDGVMMAPRCAVVMPPAVLLTATTPAAAKRVGTYMREAVESGTGRGADQPGLLIAGKTGTAENPTGKDNSWFVCFAPYGKPAIALAVVIEGGGFGSQAALPVAVELVRQGQKRGWSAPDPIPPPPAKDGAR
jgi:peptidoglycan glycosyltransferase